MKQPYCGLESPASGEEVDVQPLPLGSPGNSLGSDMEVLKGLDLRFVFFSEPRCYFLYMNLKL